MKQETLVVSLILLLIMPVYAHAQSPERISVIDNFGDFDKVEPLFLYGQVATIFDDSFLIMQIINPEGDLCQIQQLAPLPNGAFITDAIPLKGRICGLVGEYDVKLFYGDYSTTANFHVTDKSFSEPNSDALVQSAKDLLSKSVSMIDKKFDVDPALLILWSTMVDTQCVNKSQPSKSCSPSLTKRGYTWLRTCIPAIGQNMGAGTKRTALSLSTPKGLSTTSMRGIPGIHSWRRIV